MLKRTKISYWCVVVLAILFQRVVLADDFYVDVQNGSDVAGDGSASNPWKTISWSVSLVTGSQDVIHVLPGLYSTATGETFPINPSNGVDLVSERGREVTIIQGDGALPVLVFTQAQSAQTSNVEGFTVIGGTNGIEVRADVGPGIVLSIISSTLSTNSQAGLYSGSGVGLSTIRVLGSRLCNNQIGWYHRGLNQVSSLGLLDSEVTANTSDGVRISVSNGFPIVDSTGSSIQYNGGVGWNQSADLYGSIHSSLTNTTISGNGAGGVRTHADYWTRYVPPYGPIRTDPAAAVNPLHCVITGNGGFGGTLKSGTSFSSYGLLGRSICWGNIGVDNTAFRTGSSNIGTGDITGFNDISADPRWVDPAAGDFRLRFDSPCLDAAGFTTTQTADFEGELRPFDGDGNGTPQRDMGVDEFHFFVAPVPAPAVGQPFQFIAQGPPAENGRLALVLISGSDGSESGGFTLWGGVHVGLTPDALHAFGLRILALLQTPITAQQGQTAAITLPPAALGTQVFYAGVTFDWNTTLFATGTPTRSCVVQ